MVLTCTGVSFFHGSNDGQKGMGLIMLILIGTVPTAYALNHAVSPPKCRTSLRRQSRPDRFSIGMSTRDGMLGPDPRAAVTDYIRTKQLQPDTMLALRELVNDLNREVALYKDFKAVPASEQANVRNDMYRGQRGTAADGEDAQSRRSPPRRSAALNNYKAKVDKATKFIPDWVKVAVALALGLGTMVGWKRIVVTVGEKIGKEHLTYAQGASAALVAMGTIFAADTWGLPVSTTHILSSGVAGTMAANGSGLRFDDGAQHRRGLGVHAAGCGAALGPALLAFPHVLLRYAPSSQRHLARRCMPSCRLPTATPRQAPAQIFISPSSCRSSMSDIPAEVRNCRIPPTSESLINSNLEFPHGRFGNDRRSPARKRHRFSTRR